MKHMIIDILFSWLTTPILHLNLLQIFVAVAEFITICWIVTIIWYQIDKYKEWRKKNARKNNEIKRY